MLLLRFASEAALLQQRVEMHRPAIRAGAQLRAFGQT